MLFNNKIAKMLLLISIVFASFLVFSGCQNQPSENSAYSTSNEQGNNGNREDWKNGSFVQNTTDILQAESEHMKSSAQTLLETRDPQVMQEIIALDIPEQFQVQDNKVYQMVRNGYSTSEQSYFKTRNVEIAETKLLLRSTEYSDYQLSGTAEIYDLKSQEAGYTPPASKQMKFSARFTMDNKTGKIVFYKMDKAVYE